MAVEKFDKQAILEHFEKIAAQYDFWKRKNWYYYNSLKRIISRHIPPEKRVIEVGCATGDILASVVPSYGLGVDVSREMIKIARDKHPQLNFIIGDAHQLPLTGQFDAAIMCDLIDHLPDVQVVLGEIRKILRPDGRLIITTINPLWEPLLKLGEKMGWKMAEGPHNYVSLRIIQNLLEIEGFQVRHLGYELVMPKPIPLLADWLNACSPHIPLLYKLGVIQYIVASPEETPAAEASLSCSIVIPCHNEEGNLEECVARVPRFVAKQEIIIVDDGSSDDTAKVARSLENQYDNVRVISYLRNQGKGFAVNKGFETAEGEVLMILDADMAVPPEELPRFYQPLAAGKASFVNGTRMIYPMEQQAMRYLHLLGNAFFTTVLSWLIGQRLSDTLCGTKAMLKQDFKQIEMGSDYWGDFDLLFGVARLKRKIVEIPVHYQRRQAGASKMKTFKHGLHLLGMCCRGLWQLKLRPYFCSSPPTMSDKQKSEKN